MKKERTFNKIEEQLLSIPTWRLITEVVIVLAALAILLEPDKRINPVKVVFDNAESIAIASAVVLYFKEIPERKKQRHYEAWQVIDNAKDIETSYARKKALEDLYQDVSLRSIDLSGANLEDINLTNADIRWADLRGANLTSADLRGANLVEADLRGADLIDTNLRGADLRGADLSTAILSDANLRGADLGGADLTGADLSTAKLTGADLNGADLFMADLFMAVLIGANLRGADLTGADFCTADLFMADLSGADLSEAKLFRANLRSAKLFEANIENIEWNNATEWPDPTEVAKALNIPEALKQQLRIPDTAKPEALPITPPTAPPELP